MTKNIIETENLSKIYELKGKNKTIKALDNINISIQEGEVFGLLGPNGAGKTTLISILTTLVQPTSGMAFVDGLNVVKDTRKIKSKFSLMMDNKLLYYRITAYDNLKFMCKLYKIQDYQEKINKIVQEFGIEDWLDQYVSTFSTGMKMKLALCRNLLLDRDIMFLDEPTLGLDVKAKKFVIDKLKKSNQTILLTTHDMGLVDQLCDRIAFINKGEILKVGTKSDVKKLHQREIPINLEINGDHEALINELSSKEYIFNVNKTPKGIKLSLQKRNDYQKLFSLLQKYDVMKIKEEEPSLEELFLKIIE